MIKKVDHLGIYVRDLEEACAFYVGTLGFSRRDTPVTRPDGTVGKIAMVTVGDVSLELIESAEQAEATGGAIHHIAFEVDNIERQIEDLAAANVPLDERVPRKGATAAKIVFLPPEAAQGLRIQLCEM